MPNRAPLHRTLVATAARRASPSRIYGRRWQKLRAAYLARHPLCECGCGQAAAVVDHIRPHGGDLALVFDWTNLQALAKTCHDRKTAARDGGFGNPVRGGAGDFHFLTVKNRR
jgi:5-methylcytosine-specific restriction protein A